MKRLGALVLVLLMSFSNAGFALSTHFCGGRAVASALVIGEAHLGCGMESELDYCANTPPQQGVKPIPCCKDETHLIGLNETINSQKTNIPQQENNLKFLVSTADLKASFLISRISCTYYIIPPPPDISRDRFALFQIFLI